MFADIATRESKHPTARDVRQNAPAPDLSDSRYPWLSGYAVAECLHPFGALRASTRG